MIRSAVRFACERGDSSGAGMAKRCGLRHNGRMSASAHPIYFVRHGAVSNPRGIRYRRLPGFPLSLQGWQQAQQVRRAMAAVPLQGIVHSPLERAEETASVMNQSHGLTLAIDERLHEWGEGESMDVVVARMTSFWEDAQQMLSRGPIAVVGHRDPTRALLLSVSGQLREAHAQGMGDAMPLPLGGVYRVTPIGGGDAEVELIFAAQ